MDTIIIAVFAVCEDIPRKFRQQDDIRAKMTIAKVMTTAIVAILYFGGNFERSRIFLKELGYIPKILIKSRLNCRFHQVKPVFSSVF